MTLEEVQNTLGRDNGIELTITPLEPADLWKSGEGEAPAHIVQYYNKLGDDTIMLVVGGEHKIVAVNGELV